MTKNLFLVLLLAIQTTFGQITSYDNSFASNGKYTTTAANSDYHTKIIENGDGSIYFTYAKDNASLGSPECVISKLNSNGTLDTSFGNNGEITISNYYTAIDSQLTKQTDGKLLVFCFNSEGSAIARILPNGQIDTTFGANGVSKIPNLYTDFNGSGYGLYLQNNKIIIYGQSTDGPGIFYKSVYKLNNNGSIDTTFGNNGSIKTVGNFIFLDGQSNIVSLISDHSYTNASVTYPNGGMEKYDGNGQPLTGFGNNGVLNFTTNPGAVNSAFLDSNDKIICSNIDNEIFRINQNGSYDNSFNFDINSLPFNALYGQSQISWKIVEKSGSYYISGISGSSGEILFISKLTSTGAIDPVFNYYSETTDGPVFIDDMIINNNSLYAARGNKILKFSLNNSTLSVSNGTKTNISSIEFENPVKQSLIFSTKEKVNKMEIYSVDGKIVRTLKDSNTNVSELSKGIYLVKVTFENGKTTVKKLIKD